MEIQIGEYVRSKFGDIAKVVAVKDTVVWTNDFIDVYCRYNEGIIEKTDIAKHSFNLIDLIEVGDYVNGKEIILKDENENCVMYGFKHKDKQMIWYIYEEDIHSIVTHEQFASVEYKVGGENERN